MKHLVLIDGNHLMHRAFWAIPRTLTGGSGEPVNVVFGVASMLISILKQEQPDALVWCFDAGDETFRHAENPTYKEGRDETPQEFYDQITRVHQLLGAMGIPTVADPKYEADDFLCAYATQAVTAGAQKVTIVTGDRDAFQLATDKIRISIPHKGYQEAEYLGPEEILKKYGVRPDQIAAYKGLVGDSSDNLPGVKGIGPKTAAELLQKYDTLEGVYEHLSEIRPAVREKLEADRESAFFCQRMAVLICDIPLPMPLGEVMITPRPLEPLITLFDELRFTLLRRRLQQLLDLPYGRQVFDSAVVPPSATPSKTGAARAPVADPDAQPSLF